MYAEYRNRQCICKAGDLVNILAYHIPAGLQLLHIILLEALIDNIDASFKTEQDASDTVSQPGYGLSGSGQPF